MRRRLIVIMLMVLAAFTTPHVAAAVTAVRVTWAEPPANGWATLALVIDGVVARTDLLTAATACGTAKCLDVAPPPRGVTTLYALRACNAHQECALSNTTPLTLSPLPAVPVLVIEVMP
jgi:hypothetical protein